MKEKAKKKAIITASGRGIGIPGVAFNRKLIDTSEEEWDQTINSNLKGAFLFTKAVLPAYYL